MTEPSDMIIELDDVELNDPVPIAAFHVSDDGVSRRMSRSQA